MSEYKKIEGLTISPDLFKSVPTVDIYKEQLRQFQREQERMLKSVESARDEKEAEELRRHQELVEALEKVAQGNSSIVIGDNANGIQIQQNTVDSQQNMTNSQGLDYEKTAEILKEITSYFDYPQFQQTFGSSAENVKSIVTATLDAVDKREDEGLIKKSLKIIKDLAVGAGGSIIATGIVNLIGMIPF
jgi:hypothetical protein